MLREHAALLAKPDFKPHEVRPHVVRQRPLSLANSDTGLSMLLADAMRPIVSFSTHRPAGHADPARMHDQPQVIFARSGVLSIVTKDSGFVVPQNKALWLPAGILHESCSRTDVSVTTFSIDTAGIDNLPPKARLFNVSPLLRELFIEAGSIALDYDLGGRDGLVMKLILDEIRVAPAVSLTVPMPSNKRLARICHTLLRDPALKHDIDDWAKSACMGRRTFTRQFRSETQMSFAAWRQQVRLIESLSRLAAGHSITEVALDLGYSNPGSFSVAFRRVFGLSPSEHLTDIRASSR